MLQDRSMAESNSGTNDANAQYTQPKANWQGFLALRADLSKCPNLQTFRFTTAISHKPSNPLELWNRFCALLRTAPQTLSNVEIDVYSTDYWDYINWSDLSAILLPFKNLSYVLIVISKLKFRNQRGRGGIPAGAKPPGGAFKEIKQSLSWLNQRGVLVVDIT